jgi:hypothetical protein
MKTRGNCLLLAMMCVMLPSQALAAQQDVGMVVKLDGKAFYGPENSENAQQEVLAFMKIRENDVFKLAPEAKLALVYFSTGRKEAWSGPLTIKIGPGQSEPVDGAGNPNATRVTVLSESAAKTLQRLSPLVDPSRLHRSGGALVRGKTTFKKEGPLKTAELTTDEKEIIETAKQTYQSMMAEADSDDILPEMYFFSILGEYDQFDMMQDLIGIMRKKQPASPAVDTMAAWLRDQGGK